MSVKVDLDKLAEALADFTFAYLITVGDDYRAHTVAVEPGADGRQSRRRHGRHPAPAATQASMPTSPSSGRRVSQADTR